MHLARLDWAHPLAPLMRINTRAPFKHHNQRLNNNRHHAPLN